MEITIRDGERFALVRPLGVLGEPEVGELREVLLTAAGEDHEVVVCDLTAVETEPSVLSELHVVADQLDDTAGSPLVVLAPPAWHDAIAQLDVAHVLTLVVDLREVRDVLADTASRPRAVLSLEPSVDAPARARAFLRDTLAEWGLDECDYVGLVIGVDELVTNAVLHARTEIDVVLSLREDRLAAAVGDRSDEPPMPREAGQWAENGRGLAMVDQLALRWGVTPRTPHGKTVWMAVARRT
ncbi:MAG: ATP-binding protein [Kineosporiaceae bacterium]